MRLEVEVQKTTVLFVWLAGLSLLTFFAPLLLEPEYFYVSGVGVLLAFLAIFAYILGPKERQVLAEVEGHTLRISSMRHPWFGFGATYLPNPYQLDIRKVNKIVTMFWGSSSGNDCIYLSIHTVSDAVDVFVDIVHQVQLNSFLEWLSTAFPSIVIEEAK